VGEDGPVHHVLETRLEVAVEKREPEDADGERLPMEHAHIDELRREYEQLGQKGFRVLAIASKDVEPKNAAYGRDDEHDLILNGYLAFLDPPRRQPFARSSITACP
jgi:Mg2+-importing ATPase